MKASTNPKILTTILSLFIIALFFLPYMVANKEHKQYIETSKNAKVFANDDKITVSELKEISLYKFAKLYYLHGEELYNRKGADTFYTILFSSIFFFAALSLIFALSKKAILYLLSSILIACTNYAINWDFMDRHIMPSDYYVWGISHYLITPISIIMALSAIWLFIAKRIDKKTIER